MLKKFSIKNSFFKKLLKQNASCKGIALAGALSNNLTSKNYNKLCGKSKQFYNILVYITTKNDEEALLIASSLIKAKLIACANILPAIKSIFYWENALQQEQETALIVKTTRDKLSQLCTKVITLHSYDCPCIVAVPIIAGNNDFLQWVHNSTHTLN